MMNESKPTCESCSMPIESGPYCAHCIDERGALQPFEERLERMVQWTLHNQPDLGEAEALRQTLHFMKTMPAWKDHPALKARLGQD